MAHKECSTKPARHDGRSSISLGESVDGVGVHSLLLLVGGVLVKLHKLGEIKLGLLEDLDLLDEHVLEGEDLGALLGDLLGNLIREPDRIYYLLTRRKRESLENLQILEDVFEG